jgi:hypothetical protein
MRVGIWRRIVATAAVALPAGGCGVIGPSCLEQQKRGTAASLTGAAEPLAIVTHDVRYDQQGSQNDVEIAWSRQGTLGGPRLQIYATSAECRTFVPPSSDERSGESVGACAIIARCGGTLAPDARPCATAGTCPILPEDVVCRSLIVTGPGNGAPPGFDRYKLHVVGDATQAAAYSIRITWFFGPDC